MSKSEQVIQNYIKALKGIKIDCEKENIVKKSEFVTTFKVNNYFFEALKRLDAIDAPLETLREGNMFKWKSTEEFLPLAIKVRAEVNNIEREKTKERNLKKKEAKQRFKEASPDPVLQSKIQTMANVVNNKVIESPFVEIKPESNINSVKILLVGNISKKDLMQRIDSIITSNSIKKISLSLEF